LPAGIENEFRVTKVFMLPTLAMSGSLAAGLVPPGPGRLTARDAYEEATHESDLNNARRWRSRFGEDSVFDDAPSVGSAAESGGERYEGHDAAHGGAEASGFLARVWGAVRGFGATANRFDERDDDGQRGGKRA
jgi:hypothetical protein